MLLKGYNTQGVSSQPSWELELSEYDLDLAPVIRGQKKRPRQVAGHSRLTVLISVEGTYIRVCLGRQEDEWIPTRALRILDVYKKALTVLTYIMRVFSTLHHHLRVMSL